MGRVLTGLLCFFLLLGGPVFAQAARAVSIGMEGVSSGGSSGNNHEPIIAIASDGENRVWAIFRGQGTRLGLFKDGHWSVVTPAGLPPKLCASQLVRLTDGGIACLWYDGSDEDAPLHLLSRHTPEVDELLARVPSKLARPKLTALADGGMIVTDAGRELFYIARKGAKPEHITLPEDAFITPQNNDDGSVPTSFVQIHAAQDQRGILWLWCAMMEPIKYEWRLRGLWKLSGRNITSQKIADVPPEQPISLVAPWKDNQMVVAVAGVGWFCLNDQKHPLTSFKEATDEIKYIERIFALEDEWFMITTPRPTTFELRRAETFESAFYNFTEKFYDPKQRTTALSQVNGLKLEPLTWKLEAEPSFRWFDRPVLPAKAGFWTCIDKGLAFISAGPKRTVRHMDWRNGLDLRDPMELARQGDDHFVVLDRATAQTRLLPLNTPPTEPEALRAEILETKSLLLEDAGGRVWGRMSDDTFQCWDKGRWEVIKVPEQLAAMQSFGFLADDHDQGWLISIYEGEEDEAEPAAAVCDFKTGKWSVFDSLRSALTARMHPGSKLIWRDHPSVAPVSSAGTPMRIGFLRDSGKLHYFDGTHWSEWKVADIAGSDARVTGSPAFDAQQRLTVGIHGFRWRLSPEGKWQRDDAEAQEEEDAFRFADRTPPAGCPVTQVVTVANDRHGVCWLNDSQGRFWKFIHGRTAPVFQPDEAFHPLESAQLFEVRSDLDGNAFLRMSSASGDTQYLAIRARLPLPQTVVTLKEVRADAARLAFGSAAWHAWRIDGAEWSKATDQKERVVTGLMPGQHELEVMAYNADLTPAKASVKLKVTIESAALAELDVAIQKLGGDDLDASEAAARRLRSQGSGTLSHLKKAREKAGERTRWWLDAVIQQIEAKTMAP